ncbi:MAG: hypothetical protein ABSA49_07425 [Rhizomicrobium sp.]|jgi:hypothetical protein
MHFRQVTALAVSVFLLAGCASVIDGTVQPIYVSTEPISGVNCKLSNARGEWSVTTPGSVIVKKSDSVLVVDCTKDEWRDAKAYFASKLPVSAMVGAMVPYVGLVSAAVDGSSGASGQYPTTITVSMEPSKMHITGTPPPGEPPAVQK